MENNEEQGAVPEIPAPKGREISNIRALEDGTYVVSINTEIGLIHDYHVCPPDVDPLAPVGLWEEVQKAAKKIRKKLPKYEPTVVPAPMDHADALALEKAEAERVIALLQMAVDVGDSNVDSGDLVEWKRYRILLERDGLQAIVPVKPDWIS